MTINTKKAAAKAEKEAAKAAEKEAKVYAKAVKEAERAAKAAEKAAKPKRSVGRPKKSDSSSSSVASAPSLDPVGIAARRTALTGRIEQMKASLAALEGELCSLAEC